MGSGGVLWGSYGIPMGSYGVLWGLYRVYRVGAVSGPFVGFRWGFFGVWGGHLEGDLCGHGDPMGVGGFYEGWGVILGSYGGPIESYGVLWGPMGWGPFRGRLWDFCGVFLGCGGVTLKGISVVMVKPWVMKGSSSGGRPFQQSNSMQRQPLSSTWRYISTEELPVS